MKEEVAREEDDILRRIAPAVRARGYATIEELEEICRWKSPRSAGRCRHNSSDFVRTVTTVALSTHCERLRIEALTLLDGVGWPTASVLLHFGAADPSRRGEGRYPIIDFRALDSLQSAPPLAYDFEFWWRYVIFCRDLSRRWNIDMRTLDRALWQHSKERSRR